MPAVARTPEKSIRLAIFWLGFVALAAGLLAAKFGPAPTAAQTQSATEVSSQ
jgi:hypothetical protein